jgi:uncharacterized RDD family membrane protein YckC
MPAESPLSESARGYLSDESKKRFTVVAGVLGAVFFVAQLILPMVILLLIFVPTVMTTDFVRADLQHSALWHDDAWFVEYTDKMNWRDPAKSPTTAFLKHMRLADLSEATEAVRLDLPAKESSPALLPLGDRLWVIGADTASYYERGSLTRLSGSRTPVYASQPFDSEGSPAVITLGSPPKMAVLHVEGAEAEWQSKPFPLNLPPEGGAVRELEVVQAGERQYLIVAVSTEEPDVCSLRYREMGEREWLPVGTDASPCTGWMPVALGQRPAVVLVQRTNEGRTEFTVITATPTGGQRQEFNDPQAGFGWSNWRAFVSGNALLLLSEGLPGSRKLVVVRDGKIVRSVAKEGSFPFGPNMMALMLVPQCLPILLALALAFILTVEMRKRRVQNYVAHGVQRTFASLWQRAWAQVVDALVLGAGFIIPFAWMWRLFSHPESMTESGGGWFPLTLFGLLALGFLWVLLVLVGFSYLEGRFGKTPGKWLLRIRVLGTDLAPCGFWRALVRNLLTFVDGFFNFLVGVLLVALTENWQRLGDLAARTIVVMDEKGAN